MEKNRRSFTKKIRCRYSVLFHGTFSYGKKIFRFPRLFIYSTVIEIKNINNNYTFFSGDVWVDMNNEIRRV